jgi:phenylacetate-coenzyme A ligase PaaK-like adenylate-forming protein
MPFLSASQRIADLLRAVLFSRKLATHDRWSTTQLASYQRLAFLRIVRHAKAASPFYRDLYQNIDLVDDLPPARLPVTGKRRLMDNFDAVVTDPRLRRAEVEHHLAKARGDDWLFDRYRAVASAGTSGLRGIFVYDRSAWRVVLANTMRWQRFAGIGPRLPQRMRICSIGADNPMHVTSRIPMSGDVGLFRLMHIEATDPIAVQVAALNAFQPDALLPYPSVAALLAREQIAGRLAIRPAVVSTHSELLTGEMARLIEQAWGMAPFNHYGLTEEPHVAADCPCHAGLHLFEDTVMVEVVDDDYRPVPAGEMGTRWLLTNLYNSTEPLIRYEVTDMLCRAAEPCACGRPFGLLQTIGGRSEDMLHLSRSTGDGETMISPMVVSLAIESFRGIREYAAEHDAAAIRVQLVVPDAGERTYVASELPRRLRSEIERHGAAAPSIALVFVDAIERSAQRMGKIGIVTRQRAPAVAGAE